MAESFERRYAKLRWALANKDKVRQHNAEYRRRNRARCNAASAERMRRYRARKAGNIHAVT
jgi:hypothetical protein